MADPESNLNIGEEKRDQLAAKIDEKVLMPYVNNDVSSTPPIIFGDNNNLKLETTKK